MTGDWISHDTHRLALGSMGLGGSWNDKSYDQNHILLDSYSLYVSVII